jgi:hypothetical protein
VAGSLVAEVFVRAQLLGRGQAMPAALIVGAGVAGLVTAFRLHRSDWDVIVVDAEPWHTHPVAPSGVGLDAARRLGLPPVDRLRDKLDIRCGTSIAERVPDRFGVTVTLSTGDVAWFDLVVDCGDLFRGLDDSLAIYAAELFGDAFDIFPRFDEALSWWREELANIT